MNMERMQNIFMQLLNVKSPYFFERLSADVIVQFLDEHGIGWQEDDSARVTGCNAGNVIVAGVEDARISFCAHMDTICIRKEADIVMVDGSVYARGGGVIGADDKSGVAVLLEAAARMHERGGISQDCHFLFTTAEEEGFLGAKHIEERHFLNAYTFVVDSGGTPGGYTVTRGVGQYAFSIAVRGEMSHAGSGKRTNAVIAAAELIDALPKEMVCEGVYVNIARMAGEGNPNTIPDEAILSGQILFAERAVAERVIEEMKQVAQSVLLRRGALHTFSTELQCEPFCVPDDAAIIAYARMAAQKAGLAFSTGQTRAGSDAQIFAKRGGKTVKISTGMQHVHSHRECVRLTDMDDCVRYVCALAGRYDCLD